MFTSLTIHYPCGSSRTFLFYPQPPIPIPQPPSHPRPAPSVCRSPAASSAGLGPSFPTPRHPAGPPASDAARCRPRGGRLNGRGKIYGESLANYGKSLVLEENHGKSPFVTGKSWKITICHRKIMENHHLLQENHGKSPVFMGKLWNTHHFSLVNQLFLWPFPKANC